MATNIPPHNMTEIIDGTIAFIDDPSITIGELMKHIPGPDFPTEAIIYGRNGIKDAYETGRGHILLRATADIEKKKDGRETIVITQLPYQVNKARLIESIVELINDKRIEGISNIRDESNREGIRVVIELKRNEYAEPILNTLYKQTQLQTTFGIIFLTIVNNEPKYLNLKEMITHFVSFRKEVVTRRSVFELNKAEERLHILEGLRIALDNIDRVVAIIRAAKNTEEAREGLMAAFQLSEKQAQSILDMRLARLTNLERTKILDELAEKQAEIKRLREILGDEKLLMEVIKTELLEVREKYGDKRLTEIVDELPEITIEDMIKEEEVVVTMTYGGYIKRTSLDLYKQQLRGRQGQDRHFRQRRRLRQPALHRLDPLLYHSLHLSRQGPHQEGPHHPRVAALLQGQAGDQPDQGGEGREDHGGHACQGFHRRQVSLPRDAQGTGKKDEPEPFEKREVHRH